MSEDKKPGLLKRMFSFGFGKKNEEAGSASDQEVEAAAQEARIEAERLERERLEAEKAEAERLQQEAQEQARLEAEALETERIKAEEEAAAKEAARLEAEKQKAKADKLAEEAKEEEAKKAAAEKAARLEKEAEEARNAQLAREQQERERLEAEALKEKERLEALAMAEAEAKADAERKEAERLAAEEEAAKAQAEEEQRLIREAEARRAAEEAVPEGVDPDPEPQKQESPQEQEKREAGWFRRLTKGLAKSSSALTENITSVFTKKKLDEDTLQDLEDILIQADLGVETAMNITDALASQRMGKDVTDEEVRQVMAEEIEKVLEPVAKPLELDLDHQPHVILVVGVNGSGKTTTIGKISQKLYDAGFSTLLVAGDTFRAAAVEQLHIWGERTQAPVISRGHGADAAGLAYDAYSEAVAQKKDVMLMDTAGRLQNKKELMDELEKIVRVLKKQDESAPHTVLLTLDATTGQNALNQVEIFKDVAGVNGLVMTKLDGTARGGILVSISAKHKLPVYFIGVGEQVEDLEPFEAGVFARAIAGIE